MGIVELITIVTNIMPVVGMVKDIVGAASGATDPVWWAFGLKVYISLWFLIRILPYLEKLSLLTATKWDDSFLAKVKNLATYGMEIISALGVFDPRFLKRLKEVRLRMPLPEEKPKKKKK